MESWKTLTSRTVFKADPYVRISVDSVELPDGRVVDDFYQVKLREFSLVVPVMEDGRILVIRQYKHGPRRSSITFPAGFVDPEETPYDAALRELVEETGCKAGTLMALGSFVDNGNQHGCRGNFFLARGCRLVQAPQSGDLEDMQAEYFSAPELDDAMQNGGFAITHMVAAWGLARMDLC